MVLYLLIKPHILVQIIHNLLLLDPYLRKIQPDLLLISSCGAVIMPLGYILSRMREKKYLCWAHGDDFIVHTHYSLKSFYLKPINKIIVTCNRMKDLIIKINHLNDDKIIVIPIGLDLSESIVKENKKDIRKELNIHDDEFILISVGRHAIRKNFQIVIKAVNKIKKSHPQLNLKYILVGQGKETQNLKDLTKKLNLEKEVLFFGAVNDVRKNKYLKAADVFVTPSITLKNTIEGFGIVFLEANYHKVPVIGTFAGGIPEAIENYKSGILVKPNDLSGLINAIVYLYKNVDERRKMGEYGHKKVIKNHNWEILINEYIKLFKEIIE
ncbi:MAG: glycosyltransferase family 4 protein [Promethearchaeota archaeon]